MAVAAWSGSLLSWERELAGLKARLAGTFGRAELRRSAGAFIDGALSGVSRKTVWQLAVQPRLGAHRIAMDGRRGLRALAADPPQST